MKAWTVFDEDYEDVMIVFAETKGKAMSIAFGTEVFPKCDYNFIDLKARRIPPLDKSYRNKKEMNWDNDEDRLDMIKEAGFSCSEDIFDERECEVCVGKEYCEKYKEYKDELKA